MWRNVVLVYTVCMEPWIGWLIKSRNIYSCIVCCGGLFGFSHVKVAELYVNNSILLTLWYWSLRTWSLSYSNTFFSVCTGHQTVLEWLCFTVVSTERYTQVNWTLAPVPGKGGGFDIGPGQRPSDWVSLLPEAWVQIFGPRKLKQ